MSEAARRRRAFAVRSDLDAGRPRARYPWGMRTAAPIVAIASAAFLAPAALAQFDEPTPSDWASRIVGEVTSESGAPTIDSGDEIAAIFNGEVVGLQRFGQTASGPLPTDIRVFGDDPETPEQEGPPLNAEITFQFFDQSTGMIRNNVVALNTAGEVSLVRFQGANIDIGLPDDSPLPDDLLIPVQEFDLRLTAQDNAPGGGGGGGGGGQGDPDVNGDGTIDKRDVALVLRAVIGASRRLTDTQIARADVDGDGTVTTADAIEIIRQQ